MRWAPHAGVLLLATAIAHADPDPHAAARAKQLFDEGRELAKAGHTDEACNRFDQSFTLDPQTGTEVNLADCLEKQGKLERAFKLFDAAASDSLRANNVTRAKFARARADAIAKRLPAPGEPPPQPVEPPPTTTTTTTTTPSTTTPTTTTPTPSPTGPALGVVAPSDERAHRMHLVRVLAYTGGGIAGFGAVVAIYAKLDYDAAKDAGNVSRANRDVHFADGATVLAIASGACLAVAGYLYFTAPDHTVIAPAVSASSAGVFVLGRF